MSNRVETIAKNSLNQIVESLNSLNSASEQETKRAAKTIFRAQLAAAFAQVSKLDRHLLIAKIYEELASNEEVYSELENWELINLLQSQLNKFYMAPNLFNRVRTNFPMGIYDTLSYFLEKLKPMLFAYKRYYPSVRWPTNLVSWLFNIALILVTTPVLLALSVFVLGQKMLAYVNDKALNLVTNGKYKQQIEYYEQDEQNFAQAKGYAIAYWRRKIIRLCKDEIDERKSYAADSTSKKVGQAWDKKNQGRAISMAEEDLSKLKAMSDEEFIKYVMTSFESAAKSSEQESEKIVTHPVLNKIAKGILVKTLKLPPGGLQELYESAVKEFMPIYGINKLKLVAKALLATIGRPLSANIFAAAFSLAIVRPIQLFMLLLLLITTAALESYSYINTAAFFTLIGANLAIKASMLFVVNAPLYLLDGYRSAKHKMSSLGRRQDEVADAPLLRRQKNEGTNDNSHLSLRQWSLASSSSGSTSQAPMHYKSPLAPVREHNKSGVEPTKAATFGTG